MRHLCAILPLVAASPCLGSVTPDLRLSEVRTGSAGFVEVHNPGEAPVELGDYFLRGDLERSLPPGRLGPGIYRAFPAPGFDPGKVLRLELLHRSGEAVDLLRVAPAEPSLSMQRVAPDSTYRGPQAWRPAPPTPNDEPPALPALFSFDDTVCPNLCVPGDPIVVRARYFGPASARLEVRWRTRSRSGTVPLSSPDATRRVEAVLPGLPSDTLVHYEFVAKNQSGETRLSVDPATGKPLRSFVVAQPATALTTYYLELPEAERVRLFERPERHRFPATLTVVEEGVARVHSGVKVQVRGGTWTRNWLKRAWVVSFPKGSRLHGQRKINLRSGWHDPSMLRDLLGFEAYRRAGVPAPRAKWVRVHINGVFRGVFTEVEMIDARLLRAEGLAGATLYQARAPQRNSGSAKADGRAYDSLAGYEVHWQKLTNTATGHEDLRDFIAGYTCRSGADLEAYFEENLDVETYVSYLAVTVILSHWDSLIKNYYWARRTDGKWLVIPWDLDRAWGDHYRGQGHNSDPILLGTKDCQIGGNRNWWNKLRSSFLSVERFRDALYVRIRQLLSGSLLPDRLIHEIRRRFKTAKVDLEADRREWGFYQRDRSSAGDEYSKGTFSALKLEQGPVDLERYVRNRSSYLLQRIKAEAPHTLAKGVLPPSPKPTPVTLAPKRAAERKSELQLLLGLACALGLYVLSGRARDTRLA